MNSSLRLNKVEKKKNLMNSWLRVARGGSKPAARPNPVRFVYTNIQHFTHTNMIFHVSIAGGPFDSCQQLDCHRTTVHHFLNFLALRISGVAASPCHETLKGRGLLKSHGLSETPIV